MGTGNSKGISDQEIIEQIDQAINEERKAQQIKNLREVLSISDLKKCEKPHKTVQGKIESAGFDSIPIPEKNLSQEKAVKRITYDQDGRIRVKITNEWPYSVHDLLSMKFNDKLHTGTATMIGPNIAITAARNLYDFENQIEVKVSDIHFYPAANDQLLPFGTVQVQAFYYPEEFKTTGKEDYAILILEQDIGHQTGYFGVHAMEKQSIKSKRINITGYPADKVADKPKHHQMWGMEGRVCHVDDDLISYQIDTSAGQSGGGIWYGAEDEYYVVGVHVHYSGAYNQGTFINKKRLERIRDWIWSFYSKSEQAHIQVQSLNLANEKIGKRGAEYLSKANFPQLELLNLYQSQIGDKGAEYLSKSNFPQLQKLELPWNEIGEKGAEYLSKANFPQLQSLELIGNKIGKKGAEYLSLANSPRLQFLDLSSNRIGDKAVEYLSKANFPQLLSLHLSWNQIGDNGAKYLSKANFPQLESLQLTENKIGNKGIEHLSKTNFLKLESLQLMKNKITHKGVEYLSKANFLQLRKLDLSMNDIGDKGAEFLSKANFPQLESLNLYLTHIGEKGVEHLSTANFSQLQSLHLSKNQIGDKGVEHLSKANFLQLQLLDLYDTQIGDQGVEFLSKANFSQLQSLNLSWNQIGDKGAEYLSKANFRCLQSLNLQGNQIGKKGAASLSYYSNKINL